MNIHVEDNFLTSEECSLLIDYCRSSEKRKNIRKFFLDSVVPLNYVEYSNIRILAEKVHYKIAATLLNYYDESIIYPESTDLVYWKEGKKMGSHYDAEGPDLKARCYTCIVYLNDDYEGGETYFKKSKISLKRKPVTPKRGRILVFPSDRNHCHGINKVKNGERYTLASWWTRDDKKIFYIN